MAAPLPVEMPAARLRKGDVLPTYGATATVVRPPVRSVDGAMVNVLLAHASHPDRSRLNGAPDVEDAPTLVRLPVGLPVEVIRDNTAATPFVRATKVAKSSGARIALLDLLHPDSEVPAEPGEKFATLCTVHHTLKTHAGISTAQAQATHPEQWCAGCLAATQDLARQRVWGINPHQDVTGTAGEVTA